MCSTEINPINPTEVSVITPQQMNVSDTTTADEVHVIPGSGSIPAVLSAGTGFYSNFFEQYREFKSFTPTVFYDTAGVFSLYAAIPQVDSMLKNCKWFKGAPTVKIVFTGSPALYGAVRFVFTPVLEVSDSTYDYLPNFPRNLIPSEYGQDGFYYSSGMPHLDFDVSCICEQEISLPYHFAVDHALDITATNDWNVTCYMLHPITANFTGGSTTTKARLFVKYTDVEYVTMELQSDESSKGVLSKGLAYLSGYDTPYSKVLSLGSQLASSMGWSKIPAPPEVMRTLGDMSSITGAVDTSYTLANNPHQLLPDRGSRLPGEQLTRKMLTGDWSPLYMDLQALARLAVHPCANSNQYDSKLSTYSTVHKYWRGELEIMVKIFANALIRGKIAYNIHPPGAATTVVTNGSAISGIIDINGSTEVIIKVPYLHYTAFKEVVPRTPGGSVEEIGFIYNWVDGPWDQQGSLETLPFVDLYVRAPRVEFTVPTLKNCTMYRTESEAGKWVYGEQPDDVLQLCKRTVRMAVIATENDFPINLPISGIFPDRYDPVFTGSLNAFNLTEFNWTFDTYFRSHALAWSGSCVHIIDAQRGSNFPHQSILVGICDDVPGSGPTGAAYTELIYKFHGDGEQLFSTSICHVRTPSATFNTFIKTDLGVQPTYALDMRCVYGWNQLVGSATHLTDWYLSAGDDRQLSFFIPMKQTQTHL